MEEEEEVEEEVAGNYLASVLTMFATRFLREGYSCTGGEDTRAYL